MTEPLTAEIPAPEIRTISAPDDTRNWTPVQVGSLEGWKDPNGVTWVRARADETPELRVTMKTLGLAPMLLVRAEESMSVTREARKARREERELTKRGLA